MSKFEQEIQKKLKPIKDIYQKYDIYVHNCEYIIGPGWIPLIEDMIVDMIGSGWFVNPKTNKREIYYIKEKFGELRILFRNPYQLEKDQFVHYKDYFTIECIVDDVEYLSSITCDVCGKPGKSTTIVHYMCTRCPEHSHQIDY